MFVVEIAILCVLPVIVFSLNAVDWQLRAIWYVRAVGLIYVMVTGWVLVDPGSIAGDSDFPSRTDMAILRAPYLALAVPMLCAPLRSVRSSAALLIATLSLGIALYLAVQFGRLWRESGAFDLGFVDAVLLGAFFGGMELCRSVFPPALLAIVIVNERREELSRVFHPFVNRHGRVW